jgi:hypothetical protein
MKLHREFVHSYTIVGAGGALCTQVMMKEREARISVLSYTDASSILIHDAYLSVSAYVFLCCSASCCSCVACSVGDAFK